MNKISQSIGGQESLNDLAAADAQEEDAASLDQQLGLGGDRLAETVFSFVGDVQTRDLSLPLTDWLEARLNASLVDVDSLASAKQMAQEIVEAIERAQASRASLDKHIADGRSRESWFADCIERGASVAAAVSIGDYAARVEQAMVEGGVRNLDAILTRKPDMFGDEVQNANPHLHGFLAEADMTSRFNLQAEASNASVRARMLGETTLNSADIELISANGAVLAQVQVKSYADINRAIQNIRAHNYAEGTTLLVHTDQVVELQRQFPKLNVTSNLEVGGVRVEMESYAAYKAQQNRAQLLEEARTYEWSEVNRVSIAKGLLKQAVIGAAVASAFQASRLLGRRLWNRLQGRDNPPIRDDAKAFIEGSGSAAKSVSVQVAVSGAFVVAAKNGWLGKALKGTPAGQIANMVYVGMENARVLVRYANGEITGIEAVDQMGLATSSAVGGLVAAGYGASQGAAIGAVLGPLGVLVGGVVGGLVAGMAGSQISEAVYTAGKAVANTAVRVAKGLWSSIKSLGRALTRSINPFTFA